MLKVANQSREEVQVQPPSGSTSGSESESLQNNMDSDSELDLESLMESDDSRVSSVNFSDYQLAAVVNELRAELTPVGWLSNPQSCSQHASVSVNYRPATPIYSPTSPDHSPSQSPVHVDSESEHGYTPPHNSDMPITASISEMFELENTDSDQEIDGEAQVVSLVGNYINRGKLPRKMLGIYIFP